LKIHTVYDAEGRAKFEALLEKQKEGQQESPDNSQRTNPETPQSTIPPENPQSTIPPETPQSTIPPEKINEV